MTEENIQQQTNNSAKFAFLYMLSLVSLVFFAIAVATVAFQTVNKNIVDLIEPFRGRFSPEALKFAISSILIAGPIYYFTAWQINKNLAAGKLALESGVRKWLTYFILFVSSVVMIGWLIGTLFNFLDGELTLKFILKAGSAILIAAAVFSFYLYDIRRTETAGKDKVIRIFFYGSIVVALAALVTAFYFAPSPAETRARKRDNETLNRFNMIEGALQGYWSENKKLPADLEELTKDRKYLSDRYVKDAVSGDKFGYKVLADKKSYELCATFLTSNRDENVVFDEYLRDRWPHQAGYQCVSQAVIAPDDVKGGVAPLPRGID